MADMSQSRICHEDSDAKPVNEAPIDLSEPVRPDEKEPAVVLVEDKPMLDAEEEKKDP